MTIDEFFIIEEHYANHDHREGPEDGCQTCVDYFQALKDIHDTYTELEIEQALLEQHDPSN